MRKMTCVCALVLALTAGVAMADDPIQGNWEGKISKGALKGSDVLAQIMAQGDTRYEANLIVTTGEKKTVGTFKGKRATKKATLASFTKDSKGGPYEVTGTAENGVFKGELKSGRKTMALELKKVYKKSPTLGQKAPEGAIVLFDGSNMDAWTPWGLMGGGDFQVGGHSQVTKQEFGSHKLHLEFKTPFMPSDHEQARGNSGVYVFGRYEMQVLDSFGQEAKDNYCGGIYKKAVPIVNACLPPNEWQTYDITFTAPKYDGDKKVADARITALHNGILIHDDVVLPSHTPGGVSDKEAPKGVLMLQHHGDNVRYRNIWVVPAE